MYFSLVFCVYDSKAEAFLQPFFCSNEAVALRTFAFACQDSSSDFHRFSGDYSLFLLGEWDAKLGQLKVYEAKKNMGLASQFVNLDLERSAPLTEVK